MLHTFRIYGQYYALDTGSGAVHIISPAEYDLLGYVRLPFENELPSSLRYDLAKYSSTELAEGYKRLSGMYSDGVLFSENTTEKSDFYICDKCENTVIYSKNSPIFASRVISLADSGILRLSAEEDKDLPVSISDYDIVCSEYERVAKEIIKRKTGRIPGKPFEFLPFSLPFEKDKSGYTHITSTITPEIFSESENSVKAKIIECACAVNLL